MHTSEAQENALRWRFISRMLLRQSMLPSVSCPMQAELKIAWVCRRALASARAAHAVELTTERRELEAQAAAAALSHAVALKEVRAELTAELEDAREVRAAERSVWDTERERQGVEAGEAAARLVNSRAAAAEWQRLAQQLEADVKQQVYAC